MAKESLIQWTEATWNPWHGCAKVSEGCKFCYMYRGKEQYKKDPTIVQRSSTKFKEPLKWKEGKLIFTCSWSDWFVEDADEWRNETWEIIKQTPHHTYQILTKRPERILQCLPDDWGNGYPNVWLGVTSENMNRMRERLTVMRTVPAVLKFVSAEPLLGSVASTLTTELLRSAGIGWIIVGGESGNNTGKYRFRPMEEKWADDLVMDCLNAEIPIFVKQLGTWLSKQLKLKDRHGGNIQEFPSSLQVRQMPRTYKKSIKHNGHWIEVHDALYEVPFMGQSHLCLEQAQEAIDQMKSDGLEAEYGDAHNCYANSELMEGQNGFGEYCTVCGCQTKSHEY